MSVHAQHVLELILFIVAGACFLLATLPLLAPVALRLVAAGLFLATLAEVVIIASVT